MKHREKLSQFTFPLPVDPLRALTGLRDRIIPIAILVILCALAGTFAGSRLSQDGFAASLALIQDNRERNNDDIYRPRDLREETLMTIADSNQVLEKVGKNLNPVLSPEDVKARIQMNKGRREELFNLIAYSKEGKEDAISLLTLWAEEIVASTREIQRTEAKHAVGILTSKLEQLEPEIHELEGKIVSFSEKEGILDESLQVEAFLAEQQAVRQRLAEAKVSAEANRVQMSRLVAELKDHHPVESEIKMKEDEIRVLRGRYTDAHPIIQEKLASLLHLQQTLTETLHSVENKFDEDDLKRFSGTPVANELYMQILNLKGRQDELDSKISSNEKELERMKTAQRDLPYRTQQLALLKGERDDKAVMAGSIKRRLAGAQFFASDAPGYWRVFQDPKLTDVEHSSARSKMFLFGLLSALGGLALGLLFSLWQELKSPHVRTPLQAAISTRSVPKLMLFQTDKEADRTAAREFWLTNMAKCESEGRRFLFPVIGSLPGEAAFWKEVLANVSHDNARTIFIDVSQDSLSQEFEDSFMDDSEAEAEADAADLETRRIDISTVKPSEPNSKADWSGKGAIAAMTKTETAEQQLKPLIGKSSSLKQPLIPTDENRRLTATYVRAEDYSVDDLAKLLLELPPHYYVICRWNIGPTSSLATIADNFDYYFPMMSPATGKTEEFRSSARIYRNLLGVSDGVILMDSAPRNRVHKFVQWVESRFFQWRTAPRWSQEREMDPIT